MICYTVMLLILVLFGAISLMKASENNDLLFRYDETCGTEVVCTRTITPTVTLVKPKLYYRLDDFYSNHRNFVKSRSYKQLRGEVLKVGDLSDCEPIVQMKDLEMNGNLEYGANLDQNAAANPCGLIARYFFNDRYEIAEEATGTKITIDDTGIAHSVDVDSKFKNAKNWSEIQYRNVEDEHLMVWYQMETFPSFIKLWGHIDTTLEKGKTYTITFYNNFEVSSFGAKKYLYLSEVNDFGGSNAFMGMTFLIIAGIVLLIMIVFIVLYITRLHGKDIYSTENMEW